MLLTVLLAAHVGSIVEDHIMVRLPSEMCDQDDAILEVLENVRTVFTPQQVGVLVNPSCYLAKGTKRCQKGVITRRISDRVLQP